MLDLIIALIGIILTIFFVVGVHELGHFLVARACGVKVLRFSIGFGKPLYRWKDKKGTEYVLAAVPLGGYVKMLDETEGDVPKEEIHLAYNRQPIYKKLAIVAMGPIANLIFAFFLYWILFMIGFVASKPIIGHVVPGSIAAEAQLKPQQEIVSIANKVTHSWSPVVIYLITHTNDKLPVPIEIKHIASPEIKRHMLNLMNMHLDDLKPDPLASIGITPYQPTIPSVIGKVETSDLPLKTGDKVLAIDNHRMKDWIDVVTQIYNNPDKTLVFKIERHGKILEIPVAIHHKSSLFSKHGYLGLLPDFKWPENLLNQVQYSPLAALTHAWDDLVNFTSLNFIILGKMLTGKISILSLGGPITIVQIAGSSIKEGLVSFMSFLAFLSISIGIINILPIPGLDGGHVFLQIIESIIRRPLPNSVLNVIYRIGFFFLLFLIIQALANDIMRMW